MAISWDNFDKMFWVSSTNIRNLIDNAITSSEAHDRLYEQVQAIDQAVIDLKNQGDNNFSDLKGDVADIWEALATDAKDIGNLAQLYLSLSDRVSALEEKVGT